MNLVNKELNMDETTSCNDGLELAGDVETVEVAGYTYVLLFDDLPAIIDEAAASLEASIAEHGVQVPVVIDEYHGVIDGNERLRAAAAVDCRSIPFEVRPSLTWQEKCELRNEMNNNRRHREANHTSADGDEGCHEEVNQQRAKKPRILARNIKEAAKACDACQAVENGQLPTTIMDSRRVARVAREQKAKRRRAQPAEDCQEGEVRLLAGDFRQRGQEIEDESIDLVFTDPPYPKKCLPLWSDVAEVAQRVLRPGGILAAYSGQKYLPTVMGSLDEHLDYVWMGSIRHSGGDAMRWDVKMKNGWKPILIYAKPPVQRNWQPFADQVTGGSEKADHDWQQASREALHYIEALCPVGGTVLDPMIGSGTTAVAAVELGRHCIGIDEDPGAITAAKERLGME
jgi:hypothetical protein